MEASEVSGVRVRALLVRWVLVGLLIRLHDENRSMTERERRSYNLGIRALARYNGLTIPEVLTLLSEQAAIGLVPFTLQKRVHGK